MNRILQIRYVFLCSILLLASCSRQREITVKKPNIIYIYTDQQHANMMSCAGNKWVNTPAMDYIANNGIRFTRAYTTNPVCSPARISMITGRFPSYFNDEKGNEVRENWGASRVPGVSEEVLNSTIANYAQQAGYDLIFGGKEHLPQSLRPDTLGFTDISDNERNVLANEAAKYIKSNHEKPYFMIVSLINPHDICYMAIRDFAETAFDSLLLNKGQVELAELDNAMQIPEGVSKEEFYEKYCPPTPPNYEAQKGEPIAIKTLLKNRNFRNNARANYSDEDWRMHRWAYCRLTEVVDNEIQVILDALKASGEEENTLIMLSSDHGDMDAAHRMEHKSTMYEESANVPFLAMWKSQIPSGQIDTTHLISNGLDLIPTVCDFMGVEGSADPRGRSMRSLMEGNNADWRNYLGVESEVGKMVVSEDGYKFLRYDFTGIEEQLLDLNKDPFETTHFTDSIGYTEKLAELKKIYLTDWFPEESN